MLEVLSFMFGGGLLGHLSRHNPRVARWADLAAKPTLYCLLFLLGLKLGANSEVTGRLGALGLQALTIGIFCTFLSVLAVVLLERFCFTPRPAGPVGPVQIVRSSGRTGSAKVACAWQDQEQLRAHSSANPCTTQVEKEKQTGQVERVVSTSTLQGVLSSMYILLSFGLGLGISYLKFAPSILLHPELTSWAFYFLLLCVGIGMGADLRWMGILRQYSYKVLLIPFVISLGTLSGALLAFLVLSLLAPGDAPDMSLRDTLAVAAGFGYYSLSSVILSKLAGTAVGSVALLANLLRELLSLLTLPLLVRWCGRMAPLGAAASTSMDTCLPLIAAHCGEAYGIMAVFSGMILTLAVPLVLPFFYSL